MRYTDYIAIAWTCNRAATARLFDDDNNERVIVVSQIEMVLMHLFGSIAWLLWRGFCLMFEFRPHVAKVKTMADVWSLALYSGLTLLSMLMIICALCSSGLWRCAAVTMAIATALARNGGRRD